MTFTQDSDCCDSGEGQFLKIKTENGGGGDFYIIETERWAFDNIPEFVVYVIAPLGKVAVPVVFTLSIKLPSNLYHANKLFASSANTG